MSGTPEWLDDKGKIIEHKYCQCLLEQHPLLSKGEDFFTTEGVVTDKDRLLRDVFDDIKEHLTGGLVTKAKNLLEAIRMECYDRANWNSIRIVSSSPTAPSFWMAASWRKRAFA